MARGRCDHDPSSPRLRLVLPLAPNVPHFIRDAVKRAQRLYQYPRSFPELTGHSIAGRSTKIRQRRSARREAWALMAASIWRHTDRRTFRIGDQRDDGLCNGVPIARYEAETGLSRWRVSLTLREFEEAALIATHVQPVEALKDEHGAPLLDDKGKPRHRGFPAQRTVLPLFAARLGFTRGKVKKARDAGTDAWRKRRAPAASAVAILGTRRALKRLAGAGTAGALGGRGSAGAAIEALPRVKDKDQTAANAAREARLNRFYSEPPPDAGPAAKPPGSR